ncbi:MAG: hypothetical protein KJ667_04135 [Alphaproteobacteria bacterium]|nr:hypothetical protein [Alphaproteobacteria bacterium]
MLWFGKKDKKKKGDDSTAKPSREEILAHARATAAAARQEIGDETLEKIREAMMKKQGSAFEQAKQKVKSMDQSRIADNIRAVIDEDTKK